MISARIVVADLRLRPDGLDGCARLLDPEEMARADRFLRSSDRERSIASHAALRWVLGRELRLDPAALRFARGQDGRPFLAEPGDSSLDINLSHSGELAVIGFVRGARIGVDVEVHRPMPDALRIARSHFAQAEVETLAHSPPGQIEQAFFGLWTRKEAVLKALGTGLSWPLDQFAVTVPPAPPRLVSGEGLMTAWSFADIDAGPGAAASAAITAEPVAIRIERLALGRALTT